MQLRVEIIPYKTNVVRGLFITMPVLRLSNRTFKKGGLSIASLLLTTLGCLSPLKVSLLIFQLILMMNEDPHAYNLVH